jgi:PAS domain-containing protein
LIAVFFLMLGGELARFNLVDVAYPPITLYLRYAAYPVLIVTLLTTLLRGPNRAVELGVFASILLLIAEWLSFGILAPMRTQITLTGSMAAAFALVFFAPVRFSIVSLAMALMVAANLVETGYRGYPLDALGFDILVLAGFALTFWHTRQSNHDTRYRYFAQRQLARVLDRLVASDRAAAQEAARFRHILEAVPLPAVVIDDRNHPVAWNEALVALYKLEPGQLQPTMPFAEVVDRLCRDGVFRDSPVDPKDLLAVLAPSENQDAEWATPDGRLVRSETSEIPGGGRLVRYHVGSQVSAA